MSRWLIALMAAAWLLIAPRVPAEPVSSDQVMALPAELRDRLHREVLYERPNTQQRLDRLVTFLFSPEGLGMSYQEDGNYTVSEAYTARAANCLSFTMLFIALAREANLDVYPQEIEETLSWRQHDGTLYLSNHVNAAVRVGSRHFVVDVANNNVIARDEAVPISDRRLLAHYFNNLAVARLEEGDYVAGLEQMARALQLDPGYASHWSNSGVLHVRTGELAAADNDYRRALSIDPRNASALFNVANLAVRTGDHSREKEFRNRLVEVQRTDPFHQFLLAVNYERDGDLKQAIRHYRRAIQLHPEEHRFYSALANAYVKSGQIRRAVRALTRAQALSDGDTRAAYRAKLDRLRAAR
ncbi:tetratricopeptide repeat protein [Lysobacter sp. LF1]|uniref:Tetratricopeptide repeat protein n=1 Tax=Lysobacter stagni TaxID=3045172 RepID=A0ABT6XIX8_9GAMM|nr:tetratricopeptide repeat protein [Lysobacter sp. LF1]MDI9240023.1 tetratricopeptide repeat protein [Lysobacter sp. LF1]